MARFRMREPRKFNHKYIFVDERKEKLDKIVENAKRDLGMLPPKEPTYEEVLLSERVHILPVKGITAPVSRRALQLLHCSYAHL